jgi:hypothetical protein
MLFGFTHLIDQNKIIYRSERDQSIIRRWIEYIKGEISEIEVALATNVYSETAIQDLLRLEPPTIEKVFPPEPEQTESDERPKSSRETILVMVAFVFVIIILTLIYSLLTS